MFKNRILHLGAVSVLLFLAACKTPSLSTKTENTALPDSYNSSQDTTNTAMVPWKNYFTDTYLNAVIDEALINNQELNIVFQEIVIAQNEDR
jgi:outer membrane protein TolC